MPLFRCFLRGEKFPERLLGQGRPVGFYTTRFVEAADAREAELEAVGRLRGDPSLAVAPEHRTKDAKVFVEEIDEVPDDTPRVPDAGFSFFLE